MEILVGYTGFVGSNLAEQHSFSAGYNSKNIEQAYGTQPELCVYAGVRAEKYLALQNPTADLETIQGAIDNLEKINPRRLVLISTIDVYPQPYDVDETSAIDSADGNAYGRNRLVLEKWVEQNIDNHLILRLPALFGRNLKKNFLYDMINLVPARLKAEKYQELAAQDLTVKESYTLQENGFYQCIARGKQKEILRQRMEHLGFTALNFTDSRNSYQFYNLAYLWSHIQIAMEHDLKLVNLAVEPLSVAEIYKKIRHPIFSNETSAQIARYDFKTIHAGLFGGQDGYIFKREQVLQEISDFVLAEEQESV